MAGVLSPLGGAGWQFFTNAGVVLNGGQLFTYAAGSVSTPLPTYTDSTLATPNGNPVVLSAYGRPLTEIWLQPATGYKFVLQDASGNTLGTWDNITGVTSSTSTQSEWVSNNLVVAYATATTFTAPGNQTSIFTTNRRVQYSLSGGTFYGYVSGSVYDGISTTTVTVVPDTTNLNSSLSAVAYGLLNPTNPSVPQNYASLTQSRTQIFTGPVTFNGLSSFGAATSFSNTLTPSTTLGIVGTTLADSVQAGSVGEVVSATATSVAVSNTASNIASVALTPGDWDVHANTLVGNTPNANAGISTTSAALPYLQYVSGYSSTSVAIGLACPTVRVNVSVATTVYLVVSSGAAASAWGTIYARRRR